MTAARTATAFIEFASSASTAARTATHYIEAVANPTTKARSADFYIEIVVGRGGGWTVGVIKIGG